MHEAPPSPPTDDGSSAPTAAPTAAPARRRRVLLRVATAAVPTTVASVVLAAVALGTTSLGETLQTSTSRVDQPYLELAAAPAGGELLGTDCAPRRPRVMFTVRNAGSEVVDVPWTVTASRLDGRGRFADGRPLVQRQGTLAVGPDGTVPVTLRMRVRSRDDVGFRVTLPGAATGDPADPAGALELVLRCQEES